MKQLQGHFYPIGCSIQQSAVLSYSDVEYDIRLIDEVVSAGQISELVISEGVGRIARRIHCPKGVFVTTDNTAVNSLMSEAQPQGYRWPLLLQHIESHISWVVLAILVTILSTYLTIQYGIPWGSQKVAQLLPATLATTVGQETLSLLDQRIFSPSELAREQQQKIQQHFQQHILKPLGMEKGEQNYQLHFRQWKNTANALALPSGDIILTDAFVELATEAEIHAVLLHELGHIVGRHSMQSMVQTTVVTILFAIILGDASAAIELAAGLATVLIYSHYSRQHEQAADDYAFQHLLAQGLDPMTLSTILVKLQKRATGNVLKQENNGANDYFSSHPLTSERTLRAEQWHQCYLAKQLTCELE